MASKEGQSRSGRLERGMGVWKSVLADERAAMRGARGAIDTEGRRSITVIAGQLHIRIRLRLREVGVL